MELRREILFSIVALVLTNLFLAFGSVGLFLRMGPAIDRIMQDNVVTIDSAQEILSIFAESAGQEIDPSDALRLQQNLQQMKGNITEEAEGPIIESIEGALSMSLAADSTSRRALVGYLGQLIQVNRVAMVRVDQEAQRLGSAGAWSAVFVGFFSFVLSLYIILRLKRRVIAPLFDLYDVLESARHGEHLRRCRAGDAPREVLQVTDSVNRLLDARLSARNNGPPSTISPLGS